MKAEHSKVLDLLEKGKYRQRDIMNLIPELGCHPRHEVDVVPKYLQAESTLRKIRQIIRDLRLKYHVPILSDAKGYWICKDELQAQQYIERLENTSRAQADGFIETYKGMKAVLKLQNAYFEHLIQLQDKQIKLDL